MKILSAAMLVGLGAAGSAQAVHINPDGTGQVLVYPYYTVQGGWSTYIHVVNTTDYAKAVKVRFLEGKNSQEVLDFNLYLSPKDEWAAEIAASTSGGAVIKTADTSCIAPRAITTAGEEFRTSEFSGDSVNAIGRVKEGYAEVIEMGNLLAPYSAYATHVSGTPYNCAALRASAATTNVAELNAQNGISAPTGGLYGFASLINVNEGMKTSYDATALDNFRDRSTAIHTGPGSLQPSLTQSNTDAEVLVGNQIIEFAALTGYAEDNISALFMKASIQNDYVVDSGRDSKTDWVITFPTKRYYVNRATVRAPFQNVWSKTTSRSCDDIGITYYNREEATTTSVDDFSPMPDGETMALCNEVNTLTVRPNGATAASYDTLFDAVYTAAGFGLDSNFSYGWMDLSFTSTNATAVGLVGDGVTFYGLPVAGFAAFSNTNGTLVVDGVNVLSNYSSSVTHKGTRSYSMQTVN
jgi:hypothetical protein